MKKITACAAAVAMALSIGTAIAASSDQGPPRGPNFAEVAETLGIAEQDLIDALGEPVQGERPDFATAAAALGISEQDLMDAMGPPPGGGQGGPGGQSN
ncbi:hypothetical protein [Reinekea marinisedimentorum]|uniref:Uncharacterized protein n=1 Tax=Reinekea marinisedimentorum TaxID=230495 RepID=A0A4R3I5I0_9GAMM|nr:hypothetical protein [Reinekea marinisedimentorum]TCS41114.1 hypothetical protein BCF53_107128 [Reinekea marinisedimentorum]